MNQIDIMNELVEESVSALKELLEEEVKPLVKYRSEVEKKIFEKAYKELKELEEEV